MEKLQTPSQIASWYHSQILRIPHGKQNPTKRYLTDAQVIELFSGTAIIQEKVDGKMRWDATDIKTGRIITIYEDMTGKNTVHKHIMEYSDLPSDKRIDIEDVYVSYTDQLPHINPFHTPLAYAHLKMWSPTIDGVHEILETFSRFPSHFGSPTIEGLVVKNYDKQLFGKWIND